MLLCIILLCSCTANTENFFDYQDGELSFDCTVVYNGNENEAKIYLSAPNEEGERETVTVEYTSPAVIGGYVLEKSGGEYKGKMGGVEIPFGSAATGIVKKLEAAFSLNEDMISDIKAAENGMTEVTVISEDISGKVATDAEGVLSRIELSFADGNTLTVNINREALNTEG